MSYITNVTNAVNSEIGSQVRTAQLLAKNTDGERVTMKATDPRHYGYDEQLRIEEMGKKDFSKMLTGSINEVNALQNDAYNMSIKAMYNPGEVEAHEVTMALAKANMSLSIAKNVIDKGIQAYKEIINVR